MKVMGVFHTVKRVDKYVGNILHMTVSEICSVNECYKKKTKTISTSGRFRTIKI